MIKNLKTYLYFGGIVLGVITFLFLLKTFQTKNTLSSDATGCLQAQDVQVDIGTSSVTVTWNHPAPDSLPSNWYGVRFENIENPNVLVGGGYLSPTTTMHIEDNLVVGDSFLVHVFWVDTDGCLNWADPSLDNVSTYGPFIFPGAGCELPSSLQSTTSEREIGLTWTAPSSLAFINNYKVKIDGAVVATLDKTTSAHTIDNLTPNQTYSVELCIECDLPGKSPTIECLDVLPIATNACPAPNPNSVIFANITPTSFNVSWPIAGLQTATYRAYYSPQGVDDYTNYDDVGDGEATSVDFTGLSAGTIYQVKVCSTCGDNGDTSNCTDWKLVSTVAGCLPPENAAATNVQETQISISWNHPDPDTYIQSYKIYKDNSLVQTVNKSTASYVFNGLTENTAYQLQVCSYCDVPGVGVTETCASLGSITTSSCPAPTSMTHSSITTSSYRVSWPTAGLQTEAYRAYHRPVGDPGNTTYKNDVNSPFAVTFDGLSAETAYETRICATCGDFSSTANCTSWQPVTTLPEPGVCDVPNHAVVNAGSDQSACPGDVTTLSASPANGLAPYQYVWSSGDTTQTTDIAPITTTTYSVTMTDANGCEGIDEVVVTVLAAPSLTFSTTPANCGVNNGSATINATGGSGDYNYSYLWPSGWSYAVRNSLSAGDYTVTVTDDITGCVVEGTLTIDGHPAAGVDAGPDQWLCYGNSTTTLTANPTSGTPPYTYDWGGGNTNQSITVNPSYSGAIYTVEITDANGCTAEDMVAVNRHSQSIASINDTPPSCGQNNGELEAQASGQEGPYTFLWSTGATSETITGLGAGTYTVTVTDKNGCQYTKSETLTNTIPATVDLGNNLSICAGETVILDPTTSGTGGITYSWDTGSTASSITVTPSETTTYTVTINDNNDCTATDQITITVFPTPEITLAKTNAICGENNGTITTSISGGGGFLNYSWNTGQTTANLIDLGPGIYTLTVTDINGCTDQASIILTATPAASVTLGSDQSICEGESVIITTSSSGTGTLNYLWSIGDTTEQITVNPTFNTTYSVTVTDTENCTAEDEITITVHDLPNLTLVKTDASCGLSNGQIIANVTDGQGPYTYSWSNGANTDEIDDLAAGSYTLTLTDANGCSATQSATISNTTEATVDAGSNQTICAGESTSISAPGTGPGPYTYQWNGPDITGSGATISVSPQGTATYSVTITAANGCTAEDQVEITVNDPPTLDLGADITICEGESTTLNSNATGATSYTWSSGESSPNITVNPTSETVYILSVAAANGCEVTDTITVAISTIPAFTFTPTNEACGQQNGSIDINIDAGNYTYNWSNGATSANISNLTAGTYDLTVTNEFGCESSSSIAITNQNSAAVELGNDTTICAGGTVILSPTPLAGTGPYSYTWTGGASTTTLEVTPIEATAYYVTLTDASGCTATDSIQIDVNDLPLVNAGPNQTICPGTPVTLGGNPIGPDGASYLWSTGSNGTISSNDNGQINLSPESDTTLSLAITSPSGCVSTDQVTITLAEGLDLSTIAIDGNCQDSLGSAFVTVSGGLSPYTYAWNNGASTDTINNLSSGDYQVTVTAADGCSASTSVSVQTGSSLILSFSPIAESTNGAADGSATVNVSGGLSPYTYQWGHNNATTATISNLPSNVYHVTVTDSGGCSQSGSVAVFVADGSDGNTACTNFSVDATITEASCTNDGQGSINLQVSNGQNPITYQWSTGDTTPSLEELLPGTYQYTVADANGCTKIDSAIISDQGLAFTPIDTSVCNIVNYIQAIPMANNQVLFKVVGLSQANFESITQSASLSGANVTVNYQGLLGPRTQSLNLFQIGSTINIETWSMVIENALYDANAIVSVQLQQEGACPIYCENTAVRYVEAVQDSSEAIIQENPPIELVGYECGDAYTPTPAPGTTPLSTASTTDLFYINDFPILLTTVGGNNGLFSGKGIIPLPFNKQTVKVTFTDVSVNSDYQIWQGEVTAIAGNLTDVGVIPDTITFGGEMCVEPPKVAYAWGFDENGIHNVTGTMYDENGFDAQGNHKDTKGPYNEDGCNREGRDREGQECSLQKASPAVQAFLDTMQADMPALLTGILNQMKPSIEDTLSIQTIVCAAYRTSMDSLLSILGYNRLFVFGENDKFLKKGMHLLYEEKPDEMILDIARDSNTVALESYHIELYKCDEMEYKLENLLNYIISALSPEGLQLLEEFIINNLTGLSDEKVATFNDPNKYNEWLIEQIEIYLENNSSSQEIGYLEEPLINEYDSPKMRFNQYGTLAANGNFDVGKLSEREQIIQELDFQFQQGFKYINGVHRAFFLEELGKVQNLAVDENGENLLPIKVSKLIGGYKYTILLDNIIFTPGSAVLDAFLILEDPKNTGKRLVFEVLNAGFGPAGLNTGSTLELISETEITLSNSARLILKGGGRNYVDWDCTGFLGMHLDAEVELCRNFITPLHPVTLQPLPDTSLYRLKFEAYIFEWLDVVIGVDAPPFAITKMEDIKWELDSMFIDLSDKFTPTIEPPDGYASPYFTEHGMSPLWRGFYMKELSATLPRAFVPLDSTSTDTLTSNLTIGVEDVLIDGCGLSGQVFAENLISIADGNAGGWPFSIDKLGIKVLHNQLAGGEFAGDINVPIFEGNMRYDAAIFPNNKYKLTVHPNEKEIVDVFLAEAVIYPNSKVELELDQGEFTAIATLSGELQFGLPDSIGLELQLPDLRFCNLQISNRNPYFKSGVWEMTNLDVGMKMGGFGIDIKNIRPYQSGTPTEAGLNFDLAVTLNKVHKISAGGGFGIVGELEEINSRQKWKFKNIQVHQLFIDADIKEQVHIKGSLTHFENHSIYGEGFSGLLSADFKKFGFKADAAGQFGKKNDIDYFFVDVLVDANLDIAAGPVQIYGFGGGVSYHMENNFNAASINFGNAVGEITSAPPIGVSFSGVQYTPNENIGLGIKATALISTLSKNIFNGSVSLEVLFNVPELGGGLRQIGMKGNGHFLTPPENAVSPHYQNLPNAPPPRTAAMSAFIDMKLRFDTLSLAGDLAVYLNAGGIIYGAGDDYSLCRASVYFSPYDWYINIGTPNNRCGAILDIPFINPEIEINSYFNVGTSIPDFPELPDNVRSIASRVQSNEGLRKSGGGFMFGASLDLKYDFKAGPVKGYLNAGLGFDVMLRDYGNAICAESGQRVGMDGWYAAGQMWGYLEGGVKLFGVSILEAGLAAVLQARLPNPFWAKATVAAKVKVLFVQKRFNVSVEIGQLCTLTSDDPNDLIGMDLVTFTNPADGALDNATDIQPEAHFAVQIDKGFEVPDAQGNPAIFKASVKSFTLQSSSWGSDFPTSFEFFNDNSAVRLIPDNLLPANDSLTATIVVEILKNGEFFAEEERVFSFTTGEGFDHIPESNVAYSYPANGMYEFFKEEYNVEEGFIQLVSGQPDLFSELDDGEAYKIKLESATGTTRFLDMNYDSMQTQIKFALPPSLFNNGELYQMTVIKQSQDEGDVVISQPFYFRVSDFNKFKEKTTAIYNAPNLDSTSNAEEGVTIGKNLQTLEPFDDLSLLGTEKNEPLTSFTADLTNTWYEASIKPLIYDEFPIAVSICGGGQIGFVEEGSSWGQPEEAAGIDRKSLAPILITADHFNAGIFDFRNPQQKLVYSVPTQAHSHFQALQMQIASCVQLIMENHADEILIAGVENPSGDPEGGGGEDPMEDQDVDEAAKQLLPEAVWNIYRGEFPKAPNGIYKVNAKYTLPNGTPTTLYQILINTNASN